MRDYDKITLSRYIRVVIRQCVLYKEIGFSDKSISDMLTIAVDEIIRLLEDRTIA